jgi:hypothetical protein
MLNSELQELNTWLDQLFVVTPEFKSKVFNLACKSTQDNYNAAKQGEKFTRETLITIETQLKYLTIFSDSFKTDLHRMCVKCAVQGYHNGEAARIADNIKIIEDNIKIITSNGLKIN